MHKITVFFLVFLWFCIASSVKKEPQDTIKRVFSWKTQIKNPQSIPSAYRYDPVTDRYVYTNSVDGFQLIIL
jgi:hypothetical protein